MVAGQAVGALELRYGDPIAVGDAVQAVAATHPVLLPGGDFLRLEGVQRGGQERRFLHRHQQLLGAVPGHAALVGRVQLVQLVLVQVRQRGDAGQVDPALDPDGLEVGLVVDRVQADAVGIRRHDDL